MSFVITEEDIKAAEQQFENLGAGEFPSAITAIETKKDKNNREYIMLKYEVAAGDNQGCKFNDMLYFVETPKTAEEKVRKQHYAAINKVLKVAKATDINISRIPEDLENLKGNRLNVVRKVNGTYINNVDYLPYSEILQDIPF